MMRHQRRSRIRIATRHRPPVPEQRTFENATVALHLLVGRHRISTTLLWQDCFFCRACAPPKKPIAAGSSSDRILYLAAYRDNGSRAGTYVCAR